MIPMRGKSGAIALLMVLTVFIVSGCLDSGNTPVPDEPLAVAEIAGDWVLVALRFTDVATGELVEIDAASSQTDESLLIDEDGNYDYSSTTPAVDDSGNVVGETTLVETGVIGIRNDKMIIVPDNPQTSSLSPQAAFSFFLYSFEENELAISFLFEFPFDINFDGTPEIVTLSRVYQ